MTSYPANPDEIGIGIVDIDEFVHALGVVFCRSPLGDLDLAPGPMDVEDDEEIGRAVALVLGVVAFELAGLGRIGWRTSPMSWIGFVEADHRSLGIGRFGIEVEAHLPCGRRIRRRPESL